MTFPMLMNATADDEMDSHIEQTVRKDQTVALERTAWQGKAAHSQKAFSKLIEN